MISLRARIRSPSLPVRPTALPPWRLIRLTISLLTSPPSTISTTSMVSLSVTRMPSMNSAFLAEAFQQLADLRTAAVHHHRIDADQLHQHDVAGEAALELLVHHGVAAVLDDHGLAAETADVGQCLGQNVGDVCGGCRGQGHATGSRYAGMVGRKSSVSTRAHRARRDLTPVPVACRWRRTAATSRS